MQLHFFPGGITIFLTAESINDVREGSATQFCVEQMLWIAVTALSSWRCTWRGSCIDLMHSQQHLIMPSPGRAACCQGYGAWCSAPSASSREQERQSTPSTAFLGPKLFYTLASSEPWLCALAFGTNGISAQACCASAVQMQILLECILCKQVRICSGDMSHLCRYHGYRVSPGNSIRYTPYTQLVTTLCAGTCRTRCCLFCFFRLFFPCPGQNQSQRALEMSPWPQSLHVTAAKIPLVQASSQAF